MIAQEVCSLTRRSLPVFLVCMLYFTSLYRPCLIRLLRPYGACSTKPGRVGGRDWGRARTRGTRMHLEHAVGTRTLFWLYSGKEWSKTAVFRTMDSCCDPTQLLRSPHSCCHSCTVVAINNHQKPAPLPPNLINVKQHGQDRVLVLRLAKTVLRLEIMLFYFWNVNLIQYCCKELLLWSMHWSCKILVRGILNSDGVTSQPKLLDIMAAMHLCTKASVFFFHVRFVSCAMQWDRDARLSVDVDWDVIRFQFARDCLPLPVAPGKHLTARAPIALSPPRFNLQWWVKLRCMDTIYNNENASPNLQC